MQKWYERRKLWQKNICQRLICSHWQILSYAYLSIIRNLHYQRHANKEADHKVQADKQTNDRCHQPCNR